MATKETLVTSVSASGQVTTANNVSVTIQASGVVKDVLVKNNDRVSQGQTIATLTLDQASQQKQAAAYASYLSSKNALDNANSKYNSLQNTLFTANQKFINDAVARGLTISDPTYIEENATWLQAEADYKNQATTVSAAQSSLAAAALNLSQLSSTITAPVSGIVKGLTITPGANITLSSSSSSSTSTSQVLGSIYQEGPIQVQVNIAEIDAVKVAEGDKVTMTLDAFPNSTFTGKLVSINTNGVVSSGVTTYPAVISFDTGNDHIYPNMGVNAKIITNVKNDVVLVPTAAIQTTGGQSTIRVLKNGKPVSVAVETGDIDTVALDNVSFEIGKGEFVAIMGSSGSGKSTLMHILGALDTPSSGSYVLDGMEVSKLTDDELVDIRNKKIGFIFQAFNLLPRTSALKNVCLPMVYAGIPKKQREDTAKKYLEMVGLGDRLEHTSNQLSGGQQQRVAIARGLVMYPALLLADEPTGNIASNQAAEIMAIFQKLNEEGHTIAMITHEADIAEHAKRIIHLRDGKIVEDGNGHKQKKVI